MDRIAVTLALLALLLGSCGAPKQTAPAQTSAPAGGASVTSDVPDAQGETELTFPPAPDGDAAPDAAAQAENAPAEPEDDLTDPPAPWLASDPAADEPEALETGTVPVMPEGMDVPPMPDVNG
jgi:hypothetical protein